MASSVSTKVCDMKREEEIMNDTKRLGKVLKEGTINVQDHFEEWTQCHIVISERGITLAPLTRQESALEETAVNIIMEFSSPQEIGIVMLPDNARRSRESKLFPFAVQSRNSEARRQKKRKCSISGKRGTDRDEVILATSNGREMWEWASCIQWLGTIPREERIPLFPEPDCINMHDNNYENSDVLQNVLLKMFTYKNLPQNPINFEDLARVDMEAENDVLDFVYHPNDFFSSDR